MARSRSRTFAAFVLLTASCGGSDPRAPLVPVVPKPVAASGEGEVSPVDTTRPKDLFFVARFRDPEDTLDAASSLSGTPLSMALAVFAQTEEGKGFANIDLRVPVDVAGVLGPGTTLGGGGDDEGDEAKPPPLVGVTFGVRDVDRATASMPRGWVARPWRSGLRIVADDGVVCETPTRGRVAARVLCASSEQGARLLGGWMTRTLVNEPAPAVDARMTLFGAPIRAQVHALIDGDLREELAGSRDALAAIGVTDPELVSLPALLVDEVAALADDADQLEMDVDLDAPAKTARWTTTLRFRGTTSWTARVVAEPAERRGPPPAMFWRAPRDSDSASWSLATSPRHFAGIRRVLDKAVRAAASQTSLKPDEATALVAVVNGFPSISGAWFAAQGSIPWKMPPKGNVTPQNAVSDLKDRARAYVGWGLVGLETPAKPWIDWFSQVDAAWKKGVAVAKRELAGSDGLGDMPDLKLVRGPAGYPAGSVAIDVVGKFDSQLAWSMSPRMPTGADAVRPEHPAGKPAKGAATLRIVVIPDGPGAIIGWSLDDAALRAHVRAAMRDAPATGTLAARTDLARLRREGTGGGYFTLASWMEMFSQLATEDDPELTEVAKALAQLPNKAGTPILTFADGTSGSAPSISFEMLAQEGTVDDVRSLTQIAMGKGIDAFIKGSGAAEPPPPLPPPARAPAPGAGPRHP